MVDMFSTSEILMEVEKAGEDRGEREEWELEE